MTRISAAGNLTIEIDADRWRLIVNGNTQERVLLEASPGLPLQYIELFATKRRLPEGGSLPADQVQRVVLGWSQDDESWHLGLLLEQMLANARGSRWCEIARWPDPDQTVFGEIANQAGRSLARTIARPYNFIEPAAPQPAAPALPPLRALPLKFDLWTLEENDALQFRRVGRWTRTRVVRIAWYTVLASAYILLSMTTLSGVIALPKPEFLPYLGLVTAAVLAGLVIYTLWQLVTYPDRMVIDPATRTIRGMRGGSERWRFAAHEIEAIYASQIVNRRGKKQLIYHAELNLLLLDSRFFRLLEQPQTVDDPAREKSYYDAEEYVDTLTSSEAHSDLQMAALHIAQTLNVPCRYDQRVK